MERSRSNLIFSTRLVGERRSYHGVYSILKEISKMKLRARTVKVPGPMKGGPTEGQTD